MTLAPDLNDDVRQLVTTETIRAVDAIPNADAIEAATVRGWTVVVKKGEFVAGDEVVYFEIDSALPLDDARFAFLEPRGAKTLLDGTRVHRLKTAKLRGVYSQGLVLPVADFATELAALAADGGDLASLVGVSKFEPPLPAGMDIVAEFPSSLARKTDSERAQNLTDAWDDLVAAGPWEATEKVDGTSLTVVRDAAGDLLVCSRNYQIAEGNNPYWNAVNVTGLGDLLGPGEAVQAEVVGPGIQGNPLGLAGLRVLVFTFTRDGVIEPRSSWPSWVTGSGVAPLVSPCPVYDLDLPSTVAQAVAVVDGIKSLVAPGRLAEGVVWHRVSGEPLAVLGGRANLKAISNKYLIKNDD